MRASKPTRSTPTSRGPGDSEGHAPRPDEAEQNRASPLAVAITGGIGAGKSEALAAFARHGAATISSDDVVHELYDEDPEVQAALRERFGTSDREAVRDLPSPTARRCSGSRRSSIHGYWPAPRPGARSSPAARPPALAVNEVPLLYEAGRRGPLRRRRRDHRARASSAPSGRASGSTSARSG